MTLKDVAKEAGVSATTASRVLSENGYSSPAAGRAVRAAATKLGYFGNNIARSLQQKRTQTLGLVIADIENSFYAAIARTMETVARARQYHVLLCTSDESPATEALALTRLRQMHVDGLLITPTDGNLDLLGSYLANGIGVVQIDRAVEGLDAPSVLVNNEEAVFGAVEYLVRMGHEHIVVVSGPQSLTTGRERSQGAHRAGRKYATRAKVEVLEASFLKSESIEVVEEALSRRSSAIVAGNNVVAEACMEVIHKRNLRLPGDLSLISFDDMPWMTWNHPPITAIEQPVVDMATRATELLLEGLMPNATLGPARHVRLPAQLHIRGSVAKLGTTGRDSTGEQ